MNILRESDLPRKQSLYEDSYLIKKHAREKLFIEEDETSSRIKTLKRRVARYSSKKTLMEDDNHRRQKIFIQEDPHARKCREKKKPSTKRKVEL